MAFNVDEIRAELALGGARPTLFQVTLTTPPGGLGLSSAAIAKIPFMVQAASIPETTLGTIQVPYFGRKIKLAGDRVYAPWNITVINDEDYLIRNMFETWDNSINEIIANIEDFATASPELYKASGQVTQYSKTGIAIRSYEFTGMWPAIIGGIQLDWNATDQIETFPVTLEFDYWAINAGGGITGDAGGTGI